MPQFCNRSAVVRRGLIMLAAVVCATTARAEFDDFRALWVTRFEHLGSPSTINTIMNNSASMGITDVIFQVRGRADAFYNGSIYEPKATLAGANDPLQAAIDAAHANGMKLHAWLNTTPLWSSSTDTPPSASTVQNPSLHPYFNVANPTVANPGFRLFDSSGDVEPTGGWSNYSGVNPVLPEVHEHINNVVSDIATRYDVDGIHLDYIRHVAGNSFDRLPHDDLSHQMFFNETGLDGGNSGNTTAYRNFVTGRITDLVSSIKDTVDAAEVSTAREIELSAAVWRDPDIGKNQYLQDYRTWLQNDLLDIAIPMIYLSSSNDNLFQPNLSNTLAINTNARIAPGLGVYLHDSDGGGVDMTLTQLQRLYNNNTDGATFFSYSSFFGGSDPLATQRRAAVENFYDSLEDPADNMGGLSPDATLLADFEIDEGPFNLAPTFSGSTTGVDDATAVRTTTQAHLGEASQVITIDGAGSDNWLVRHLSGVGSPGNNTAFPTDGFLGFWLKTATPGVQVSVVVDDPESGDRGLAKSIVADNQWHLYEWDMDDDTQWEAWAGGNGQIEGPTTTLDSIQFFGTGDATIYLDTVAYNGLGSLLAAPVPGDYDGNGVVEAADYTFWSDHFGESVEAGSGADGNGDGIVNTADFVLWRNAFTAQSAAGGALDSTAVPEPASAFCCVIVGLATFMLRNRR